MKEGFYLSPRGTSIIYIQKDKDWKFGVQIISGADGYVDLICDMAREDAEMIFEAWTILK